MAFAAFAVARAGAQGVDVSSGTRLESVMALIRARDPKAGPDLASRFDTEPQPSIRAWIVRGAAVVKAPQGPALFKKAVTDSSALVRLAAVEAMAQAQDAQAVSDLTTALSGEKSAGVRHTIVFWLGQLKTPASEAALEQAVFSDTDANVRAQAARSLKQHGTRAAHRALQDAKADPDARVRAIANER